MDFWGDSHHRHGMARIGVRSHTLKDNWDGRIPTLMCAMRDSAIRSRPRQLTKHIGRLAYYRAARSG